jgi:hypothetical protein
MKTKGGKRGLFFDSAIWIAGRFNRTKYNWQRCCNPRHHGIQGAGDLVRRFVPSQIGESGSGDPIQVGTGTRVSGTTTDFSQGTILPDDAAKTTDMALDGNGFFLVE